MWLSYIYFNMKIVTKEGDEIKVRDAIGNFLNSPAFQVGGRESNSFASYTVCTYSTD